MPLRRGRMRRAGSQEGDVSWNLHRESTAWACKRALPPTPFLWPKMTATPSSTRCLMPMGCVIADQIRALGGTLADLKRIVVTHAHRSHLGGLATLKRLSGARVYSHAWEADIIAGERAAQQVSWWPQDPIVTYHFQVANNLNISPPPLPCGRIRDRRRAPWATRGCARAGTYAGTSCLLAPRPTHPVCRRRRGHVAQVDGGLAGLCHQPAPTRRVAAQARCVPCRHRSDRPRRAHPPWRRRRAAEPGGGLVLNQASSSLLN